MSTGTPATQSTDDPGLGHPSAQSADAIDRVVRLAPTWTVVALIASGLLVAAVVVWAFAGTVETTVAAPGIYKDDGYSKVVSPDQGQIADVLVQVGDKVPKGETLAKLTDGTAIKAPTDGKVSNVLIAPGATVIKGKVVFGITDPDTADSAILMVPTRMLGTVRIGQRVQIAVDSAPSTQYGYLLGTIGQLSSEPATIEEVADLLQMETAIVAEEMGDAPGVIAQVSLQLDGSTPSGYAWTTQQGAPFVITQGAPLTGLIILKEQRPIDVVFPQLAQGE